MDNLKTALFERTLQTSQAYQAAKDAMETCGTNGREWVALRNMRAIRYERYSVLFQVIEDAGLQEQFRLWKMAQESDDG